MLAKEYRLTQEKKFRYIYNQGKSFFGRFVVVKFLISKKKDESEFGIVISKKISNKATVRNKLKRQISQIIYSLLDQFQQAGKLVIIVKSNPEDFRNLKEDLIKIFKKAKIL